MLNRFTYFNISLSFWVEYFWFKVREHKNRHNLRRANRKNIYKICLTFDSNEYKIIDTTNGEHIATFKYKEFELIVHTSNMISIRDTKEVLRAFFNNPYINVEVIYDY